MENFPWAWMWFNLDFFSFFSFFLSTFTLHRSAEVCRFVIYELKSEY